MCIKLGKTPNIKNHIIKTPKGKTPKVKTYNINTPKGLKPLSTISANWWNKFDVWNLNYTLKYSVTAV